MAKNPKKIASINDLGPSKRLQAAFDALRTPAQKKFFREYWLDGCRNGRAAALKAGYSNSCANNQARLIRNSAAGRECMAAWLEDIECTPAAIMAEFYRINNASLYDFRGLFEGKTLEDLHKAGIDLRQIKKLKRNADGSIEVELYDRLKALVTQAKILKMFGDSEDRGDSIEMLVAAMAKSHSERETDPESVKAALQNGGAANGGDHT